MTSFFRDRLHRDLQALRLADGSVHIHNMLASWSADCDWRRGLYDLALAEQRRELGELGRLVFDRDDGGYASKLRFNTRSLGYLWSQNELDDILRQHTALLFANVSDSLAFCNPDNAGELMSDVISVGEEHWHTAKSAGRGVIVVSARQSHPGFAFYHPCLADLDIAAIWHKDPSESDQQDTLGRGIQRRVQLLDTVPQSVRHILRSLANGGCLMLYNDFIYPQSAGVESSLFGQSVLISSAAVAIALKTRAVVLPVAAARQWPPETGPLRLETYPAIPLDGLDRENPCDVTRAALRFGVATECLIQRFPAQWVHWDTLEYRWRTAKSHFASTEEAAAG